MCREVPRAGLGRGDGDDDDLDALLFVMQPYRDILEGEGDDAGIVFWSTPLFRDRDTGFRNRILVKLLSDDLINGSATAYLPYWSSGLTPRSQP